MEFDELKNIWCSQEQKTMYTLNSDDLVNQIQSKKRSAGKIANFSELVIIGTGILTAIFLFAFGFYKDKNLIFLLTIAAVPISIAFYAIYIRIHRKREEQSFGSTLKEELDQAFSNAKYQVRLSRTGRWILLQLAVVTFVALWYKETGILSFSGTGLLYIAIWYAASKEHNFYIRKKREIREMQKKLEEEE